MFFSQDRIYPKYYNAWHSLKSWDINLSNDVGCRPDLVLLIKKKKNWSSCGFCRVNMSHSIRKRRRKVGQICWPHHQKENKVVEYQDARNINPFWGLWNTHQAHVKKTKVTEDLREKGNNNDHSTVIYK